MSEEDYDKEIIGYLVCVALNEGQNPDMQGYAVRLSNFIANVCLAILIAHSEENLEESVSVVLLQVYTLLGSTFISIARRQLSVADAHFALTSTISPLALYLIYSSCWHLLNRSNDLFRRLGKNSMIYAVLSLLIVMMWIVLDCLIYFADVFPHTDHPCPDITLVGWIFYRIIVVVIALDFTIYLVPVLPLFWIIYSLRHFKDIREEYRRHKRKERARKSLQWLRRIVRPIKYFFLAQWDVVTKSHVWLYIFAICIAYISWASSLLIWVVDLAYFFWEIVDSAFPGSAGEYKPQSDYDPLGFGQLLAAAVAIQPLWEVFKLTWKRRWEMWAWVKGYPQSLWNGIVFIFTGHRNPWPTVKVSNLEEGHSYNSVPLNGGDEVPMSTLDQKTLTEYRPSFVVDVALPRHPTPLHGLHTNTSLSPSKST